MISPASTLRPVVHFTPASGWINDPHGITFRDGRYQVFFQYVPGQTSWGPNCHWGHASGDDLLSLRELPVAIAPGEGDDGVWSGSLVADEEGRVRAFYTSITVPNFEIGRIRVAMPVDEGWRSWRKGEVVVEAPEGLDLLAFRDPFIRREGDVWRMFVGAGGADGSAMALSYRSTDLSSWEYTGIALQRSARETSPVWMGALWECPQIFELDGRAVMVSSVWDADVLHYAGYAVGRYDDGVFEAELWGRLTHGVSYYAPSLFTDAVGRPCLLLWMRGVGGADAGWKGAHSVPHLLSLHNDQLVATPHPDVSAHRGAVSASGRVVGLAADIVWSGCGGGELTIASRDEAVVTICRDADTLSIKTDGGVIHAPASGDLRVIVDGPVLEVSSPVGIVGAAITPAGESLSVSATAGRVAVFPLA